ncbi:MAG: MBL fold metallo-hydrolase [Cytophagales bacterium]|nr:MBL fold metallo-hydrolase [Cytophagales bacterium]
MNLTFLGATRQVTGSMFLLEFTTGYKVLVDCGIDFDKKNTKTTLFPFSPKEIDAVVLTHAHLDHTGNIPNLVKEGFEGRIYCTYATYELTSLLLSDCAKLNVRALQNISPKERENVSNHFYLPKHVQDSLELFVTTDFHRELHLIDEISITFKEAGHLLGAGSVVVSYQENEERKSILFSGDIGRKNYPLLVNPTDVPKVDYVVCETTYGNRKHRESKSPSEVLHKVIQETCVERSGRLIIPAFSVGRTQALLFELNKLYVEKNLPPIKVFADSPLALKSTQVYRKYVRELNEEANYFYDKHHSLFDFDNLLYVNDMKESEQVSNYHEPCIIISSSGMVEGGRIEHHVVNNIENQYATILMIGYCAEGTFGYDLLQKPEFLKSGGENYRVMASIQSTDVFSGHGDVDDLFEFIQQQDKDTKVFLVHGEEESMYDFQYKLKSEGYDDVNIPFYKQKFKL